MLDLKHLNYSCINIAVILYIENLRISYTIDSEIIQIQSANPD